MPGPFGTLVKPVDDFSEKHFFFFFDAWSKIHKITKETYFINIVINIFLKSKLVVKKWAYLLLQEITRLSHGSNSYCHFKVIKVNGI